ncbi:MAG TPA: histidine kinase [Actinomycetes bacterium]|nr:histidine kinase [Actinomycetes bacterium]
MLASRARATGELVPARWLDAGLVVGLLVLLAAGSVGPPAAGNPAPAALVLAVAQVAALWWRRAHPVAVVAVQLVLSLVARVWLDAGGIASLAVLAGIYTVASLRGARLGILAAAADLAVKLLAVAVTGARADSLPDHLALDALALVLGLYVRARRAHLGALREREARAAVEEERRRIARELHDVVAHHVSVMTLQAGGLEQRLRAGGDQEASGAAAAIRRTGKEAMAELRRLLGVLRAGPDGGDRQPQPDLDRIEDLVARMRQAGLPVVLRRQGGRPVAAGVSLAAYRVVQEALTNTLRHAGPVATEVAVTVTDDAVQLRVANEGGEDGADNGLESAVGRRPSDSDRQYRRSAGLAGMRERVALLGGTIRAGPRPGGGWLVAAELPDPHPDGGREP